ncbi:hypothetical protein AGABI2DRAFT_195307 [Agaricus bisporus var. bisporus H97]|uniref:hypothetical protein n=1 Tax=Agaricus bisporus var. bisporus (strain H97 / ATCC MYA-4626 / FGSC 10389) TaxID=936046 RepID=UPI00029F5E87|nr:hypothetical protein AGABI2DRAFT_195307 [Agaricus bisporus var. bisporus H97]EKV43049.1 hypothetical protein AGABI2DRAFT_195307 [Agaricus bisporus var. bisporus H97]
MAEQSRLQRFRYFQALPSPPLWSPIESVPSATTTPSRSIVSALCAPTPSNHINVPKIIVLFPATDEELEIAISFFMQNRGRKS